MANGDTRNVEDVKIVMLKGEKGEKGDDGTSGNYSQLTNKPSINSVVLSGNKTSEDLDLVGKTDIKTYKYDRTDSGEWTHNNPNKDWVLQLPNDCEQLIGIIQAHGQVSVATTGHNFVLKCGIGVEWDETLGGLVAWLSNPCYMVDEIIYDADITVTNPTICVEIAYI